MGSWNETCGLSNLAIEPGERVVHLLLAVSPYYEAGIKGSDHNDYYFVRSLPLYGVYDDYGRVALDTGEDYKVELLRQSFEVDLLDSVATPARFSDYGQEVNIVNWTFGLLQDWLHDGLVRVKSDISKTGDEGGPPVKPLVVYQGMIRRDVWDKFLQTAQKSALMCDICKDREEELNKFFDMGENSQPDVRQYKLLLKTLLRFSPPFTVNPGWFLDKMSSDYTGGKIDRSSAERVARAIMELYIVELTMNSARYAWHPTSYAGSQHSEYGLNKSLYTALSKIAGKAATATEE